MPDSTPEPEAHAETESDPEVVSRTGADAVEATASGDGLIRSGKLAGRTMWSAIWVLALPVLLQQTMTACVGLVDKVLAGSLPDPVVAPAMDGIGIGSYIGWFIGIAMAGLGIGGQAIIARAIGRGDVEEAERTLAQAMVLATIWGLFVALLLWSLVDLLAGWSSLSPDATAHARTYVRTIAMAMPLCAIMIVGSMCLHGAGETTLPSMIAIGVNLVNIVASWLLSGVDVRIGQSIITNPMPIDPANWGVTGIAAGTAVSYVFGCIATLWVLRRGVRDLRLHRPSRLLDRSLARRIVRIGIPNFMEGIAMWAVNLFVLGFIGTIAMRGIGAARPGLASEEGLIGAHMIAIQWEAFSFLPGFAMGTAAGALAGQYLGAGNPRMARRAIIACTSVGAAIMGSFGVVLMLFAGPLTAVISSEPIHLAETPRLLLICGAIQIPFALSMVVRQGLRGVGDVRWTLAITVFSSYAIRLPAAWLLGVHLELGLMGIWLGLCGELVIRGTLFAGRFLHGGWARVRV